MEVFKSKVVSRFARKNHISDVDLCEAVERCASGLIDADLGGGVIKQRIARPGQGRSGGFRTVILFREGKRAIFVYGFAKNVQASISFEELKTARRLAKFLLTCSQQQIEVLVTSGELTEVKCHGKTLP